MSYYVYYLLDPTDEKLLYVGRSHKPTVRQNAFRRRTGLRTILGVCQRYSDFGSACKAELTAIRKHCPPFNKSVQSSSGRFGKTGATISDGHRQRLSQVHKGKIVSEETKAKVRASLTGKHPTLETRAKIAAANLGKKQSPETVAKRLASIMRNHGIS